MVSKINDVQPDGQGKQPPDKINKKPKTKKKWVPWIIRPLHITEWILAYATVFIAIVAILQWCALEKTDETSRLRDRAYVDFSDPLMALYPSSKPTVLGISIPLANSGNMPARIISIRYNCPSSPKSDNITDPFPLAGWSNADAPKYIGPKASMRLQGCDIPIETIKEAQQNKVDIFIVAEVKYTDGFDINTLRVTQISRSLRFDLHGGHSLGFAGRHNCTDDDCNEK